jgi:hypothetical protein
VSFLLPSSLSAYSDLESDDLKIDVTPLPVAFSAKLGPAWASMAERGALPEPNAPFVEDGVYLRSSFNDWYYRIHVIPAQLALGNLSGDTQRTVIVWNAFFHSMSLEDFALVGEGITVDSLVLPPEEIPPLEDVTYVFSISATGPSIIDGSATWTIEGVEYTIPITGVRTVLFGFKPDWKRAPVIETLEWKNTLTTSYSGFEQIMRVRQEPRRILEYSLRLRDNDTRLFDLSMFGWTGRVFGVPLWHEKVKLQQVAAPGATTLFIDTALASFADGGTAVLFNDAHDFEILDIDTVSSDSLILNNSLSRGWGVGSYVVPVMPGVPNAELTTARIVPQHVDAAVRFILSPQEAVLRLTDLPAAMTYRGYEMYTGETNWVTPLALTIAARRTEVDGGLGTIRIAPKTDFPLVSRSFAWLLKTRELADDLRAFFVRREGRRYPVWMPSGTEDFVLIGQSELGETALRVQKSSYAALINNNPAKRDIVLIMRNGDRLARRILAVEDDGDNSIITVNAGMPYVVTPAAVKRISFLGLYRMASDAVSFVWRSDRIAEVQSEFMLKKEPQA